MKRAIAVFLFAVCLFSFASCEEAQTETVLQMDYLLKTKDRIFFGEYTGETVNGIPHGYGVYVFFDSNKVYYAHYLGEWRDGEMCGNGGLYFDDGESQIGKFEQNSMVCGSERKAHSEWRYIDYRPNEHGCYDVSDALGNGVFFQGCIDPETGLYHKGTYFTKNYSFDIDTDSGSETNDMHKGR
ncbi:MAG: hypothetical protein MR842_04215 [Clostridiales bacterium]|nr:hypothetical protein [Clostridiales bacterium]MDO4349185.1 hypothetical protein [Eubacteriales bacterium]MDY4007699.1 hypothetical protein [Candidatus Limiplasma sp.]